MRRWLASGRTLSGLTLYPASRRLDRDEALELFTVGGARITGEQDVKGILRLGSYADFAVLSADYLTVPEEEIPRIESVLTVVGGRIVHAVMEHEGLAAQTARDHPGLEPRRPLRRPLAHRRRAGRTPGGADRGGRCRRG